MNSNSELQSLRHSAEHILTQAMEHLYPKKFLMAMGPATDDGFYFDFEPLKDFKISEADFPQIEAEMTKIVKQNLPIVKKEIPLDEAKKIFKHNPYKMEWLNSIKDRGEVITVYQTGDDFIDLCAGPHVRYTSKVKAFKLLSIAGAYWHGDEKNKMLTRIYGTAFESKEDLQKYIDLMVEIQKRDHRKLGKDLGLFTFSDLIGSGLPLYTPKGAFIRLALNNYVESVQTKQGYTQVWTPQIAKAKLFQTSGHYDKYKDSMFRVVSNYSEEEFFLKPMNCPQHTQIYSAEPHSYRDLPLRFADFAMLYRDEKPGELNGLARVRGFSQDDCHIFCTEEQVDQEIDTALKMTKEIMDTFGLKYKYRLSTRDPDHPEKYLGDPKIWDKVEKWAVDIMKRNKIEYFDGPGEAAFYAPKMDLIATDALGREWQLSTVQIDYVMPERFGLEYTAADGTKKRPVMLHRAIVGSPERFLMIMLEHFGGALPTWISPVQIKIIPITDNQLEYAKKIESELKDNNIRVEIDDKSETMQNKIRTATGEKIPYLIIVGGREADNNTISVRQRDGQDLGAMQLADFMSQIKDQITNKALNLIK
ncbi:MAG TPA: threonine--tRNA ligase [Candidatus Woesebacteria bacterium]|nr:threonine--tRNA ligase [Candidatus Woesebacteria bacterium]HOG37627.1 threonine--tRNA ligase [Candidatus Woesebacteria bacterium]